MIRPFAERAKAAIGRARLTPMLTRYARREDGAIAVMVAIMALPAIILTGGGVDVSNQFRGKSNLQSAADAAALAAQQDWLLTGKEPQAKAKAVVAAQLAGVSNPTNVTTKTTRNGYEVTVVLNGQVENAFLPLIGMKTTKVSATAVVEWEPVDIEVVMSLDVSGSMSDSGKFGKAQSAMRKFNKTLHDAKMTGQKMTVGGVAWNNTVNIGTKNSGWLDTTPWAGWKGCVNVRKKNYATAALPGAERFTPFAGAPVSDKDYNEQSCYKSAIHPMTASENATKAWIDKLSAPQGGTATSLGTGWGMRLLHPNWAGTLSSNIRGWGKAQKYLVLLADGETELFNFAKSSDAAVQAYDGYSAYGQDMHTVFSSTYSDAAGRGGHRDAYAMVDQHAKAHCDFLKSQKDTEIFTIQYATTSPRAKAFLQDCASTPDHYVDVAKPGAIDEAFDAIAGQILSARITK